MGAGHNARLMIQYGLGLPLGARLGYKYVCEKTVGHKVARDTHPGGVWDQSGDP